MKGLLLMGETKERVNGGKRIQIRVVGFATKKGSTTAIRSFETGRSQRGIPRIVKNAYRRNISASENWKAISILAGLAREEQGEKDSTKKRLAHPFEEGREKGKRCRGCTRRGWESERKHAGDPEDIEAQGGRIEGVHRPVCRVGSQKGGFRRHSGKVP